MMDTQVIGKTSFETPCFTDVDGVPAAVGPPFDEDVDARPVEIRGPDRMDLEVVRLSADADSGRGRGVGGWNRRSRVELTESGH